MNLMELSEAIKQYRMNKIPKIYLTSITSSQPVVLRGIENYGNYTIGKLFMYLDALKLRLSANGVEIINAQQLGLILTDCRKSLNLSQFDIQKHTSLTAARIVAVEKGTTYLKNTLETYLSIVKNVEFTIKEI